MHRTDSILVVQSLRGAGLFDEINTVRTNGEVVDPGVWKKGNPDVLEFRVRFTHPGDSLIRIERDCSMVLHDLAPFLSIHRPAIITAKSAPIAQAKFQINNRMASSRGTGLLKT